MKRISDLFLVIICVAVLIAFGVGIYVIPSDDFSEKENRVLAPFPEFSVKKLLNSEYFSQLGSFYTDRFPLRSFFTATKCYSELLIGRGENNGVIKGRDGYLIVRPDYKDTSVFDNNMREIERFCDTTSAYGIETAVYFAPRAIDVLGAYLPEPYPKEAEQEIWQKADSYRFDLLESKVGISERANCGEYVWFRTDHHWTALGAYECYRTVSERFSISAAAEDCFFTQETDGEFFGTVFSKFGADRAISDKVVLERYSGDDGFFVLDHLTGKTENGFYRYEYLGKKDKYSVFFGGNHAHIGIYSQNGGERETLMVIKDSYANAALPYFAIDFDIEVYDLRYFKGSVAKEIERISPDRILILYGIDTVATDTSLGRLNG